MDKYQETEKDEMKYNELESFTDRLLDIYIEVSINFKDEFEGTPIQKYHTFLKYFKIKEEIEYLLEKIKIDIDKIKFSNKNPVLDNRPFYGQGSYEDDHRLLDDKMFSAMNKIYFENFIIILSNNKNTNSALKGREIYLKQFPKEFKYWEKGAKRTEYYQSLLKQSDKNTIEPTQTSEKVQENINTLNDSFIELNSKINKYLNLSIYINEESKSNITVIQKRINQIIFDEIASIYDNFETTYKDVTDDTKIIEKLVEKVNQEINKLKVTENNINEEYIKTLLGITDGSTENILYTDGFRVLPSFKK